MSFEQLMALIEMAQNSWSEEEEEVVPASNSEGRATGANSNDHEVVGELEGPRQLDEWREEGDVENEVEFGSMRRGPRPAPDATAEWPSPSAP